MEHGWRLISRQIDRAPAKQTALAASSAWIVGKLFNEGRRPRMEAPWLRWAVAGQFCLLLVMGVMLLRNGRPPQYHALGSAPVSTDANIAVIFRPQTAEQDFREILKSNNARLVDGPTVADAYLLHVPAAGRASVLSKLRRQAQIVLAEPVDAGTTR